MCLGAAVIRKTAGVPLDTLQTSGRDALEASTAGSGVKQPHAPADEDRSAGIGPGSSCTYSVPMQRGDAARGFHSPAFGEEDVRGA